MLLPSAVPGMAEGEPRIQLKASRPEFSVLELRLPPHTEGPPLHHHRDGVDSFYVLRGTLTIRGDHGETLAPEGSYVLVPPGVAHTFANHGDLPLTVLNVAPSGLAEYIQAVAALRARGEPVDSRTMADLGERYDTHHH